MEVQRHDIDVMYIYGIYSRFKEYQYTLTLLLLFVPCILEPSFANDALCLGGHNRRSEESP